jgi:ABC-2 type transport system permease protein
MRAYLSYFKLRFIMGLQYRTAAIAGLCTQFFWGFIIIMVYQAFYSSSGAVQSIAFDQLVSYVWLNQAFLALIYMAVRDNEIFDMIKNGNVSYELCRPINISLFWYIKSIASRVSNALIRFWPIILVSVFLPNPYNLNAPASITSFILFLITLILGLLLVCAISTSMHILTFFTYSQTGILTILLVISDFFSGFIVPIPFMPDALKSICYILPFRLTIDLPFRTYSGNIPTSEALISILIQVVWITVFISLQNYLMKKATKKIVIQGG